MNTLTIPTPARVEVITDNALAQRKSAIELMQSLVLCECDANQADITAAASLAKGLERTMEETRVQFTKPLNDEVKRINTVAKGYADGLKLERERIEALSSAYQNAKIARIESEKAAEVAELEEATKNADTDQLRAIATRQQELARPVRVEGAMQRTEIDFEITDLNAFVAWCLQYRRMDMLKIEPRRTEIKGYFSVPNQPEIPGVTVKRGVKVYATAS